VTGTNHIDGIALDTAIQNDEINPFGTSANSQAALDSIRATIHRTGISESRGIDIKASSDIAELENGLLLLAIGAEGRQESYSDTPDALTASGRILGLGLTQARGSRDITSFFTELDWPVMDNMNIQLAARHERYSDFGTTTNPKLAVRYQPTSNLVLRASAGTGFRAPALTELYLAGGSGFQTLVDTTRCTATAAPDACNPATYQVNFTGDPDLDAEKSESSYLGAVFEPINDLSIGLDYWIYKHTDVIDLNSQYVIDNEASFSGRVVRATPNDVTTPILWIDDTLTNIADQKTRGFDIQIEYKKRFGQLGTLGITEFYSRMLEFERRPFEGQPYESLDGTYRYPTWRSTTAVSWIRTEYASQLTANYISSYEGVDPSTKVDEYLTFDLQFTYTGWDFGRATIGVTNLTDKKPPFADQQEGYDFSTHDPRGRFIFAQYSHVF
jgi:outer membrane receptor protein involved in Fe transport